MSWIDILLIALITAAVVLAVLRMHRGGGRCSGCSGDCSRCAQGRSCDKKNNDKV